MLHVNVDLSDQEHDERIPNKKANKPLMEKKRRARINRCLYEMKQMLVESAKSGSASHSKWEKADILEMTVAYIRQLQTQVRKNGSTADTGFCDGYAECFKEVQNFNASAPAETVEHNKKLHNHLNSALRLLKNDAQTKVDTFEEPNRQKYVTSSEPSPSHSQTSPSLVSSGTPSPRQATPDAPELFSRISGTNAKRRRKSSDQSENQVVPLPSTFCMLKPSPNRTPVLPSEPEPRPLLLPSGLDPNFLSQLLKFSSTGQWPILTNPAYYSNCGDLLALNSLLNQNVWRPF